MSSSKFRAVEVRDNGTATLRSVLSPHGQGPATAFSMICSELTSIPFNSPTSDLGDDGITSVADLPSFEVYEMVTPTDRNSLGAKGTGESGTVWPKPAVLNAGVDLARLGVGRVAMRLSSQRVWNALRCAMRGRRHGTL